MREGDRRQTDGGREISFCDLKHSNCVHFIVIRFNRVEGSCVCDWWVGGGG